MEEQKKPEYFEMDLDTIERLRREARANVKASVVTGDIVKAEELPENDEE